MKKKLPVILIGIVIIAIAAIYYFTNNKTKPILRDGTINNSYWKISKDQKNNDDAFATRNGINNAIRYASKKGIKKIKLEKGNYYINVNSKITVNGQRYNTGIRLLDNVDLDLNGSTIYVVSNNLNTYSIVLFSAVKNASIRNGSLVGDRDIHSYSTTNNHSHGMGINIFKKSSNITISDLDISAVTGDGIYILNGEGALNTSKIDKNQKHSINIINNNIHYFRRDGISIIEGNDIYIYNNKIHDCIYYPNSTGYDKYSVAPRAGIDLERNNINQMYSNIFVINNQVYDVYGSTVKIEDNVFNLDFENNQISKAMAFNLDASKAYKYYGDYTKADYSTFKVCNTLNDFVRNTSSTVINNRLIDKEIVTNKTEKYYDLGLNNNIYSALQFIEKIDVINSKTLKKGSKNVTVKFSSYIKITPSNAHNKKMYWTIEDESIITWGNAKNPIETPRINAIKAGQTYLIGRTIDGSDIKFKIKVIVTE